MGDTGSLGATMWTPAGPVNLKVSLTSVLGLDLTGWTLDSAEGIAADGLTITGYGTNPSGQTEGWVAVIPAAPTACAALLPALVGLRSGRR